MAEITKFNITSVGSNTVTYEYECSLPTNTTKDHSIWERILEITTEGDASWSFSTTGGTSTTNTCSYTPGGDGTTTYVLTATLEYKKYIVKYGWKKYGDPEEVESYEELEDDIGKNWKTEYVYLGSEWVEGTGRLYKYNAIEYYWTQVSESEKDGTPITSTVSFFPKPASFSFNNCAAGEGWYIDQGLNSLITNLTSFQSVAQQWKCWKNQTEQSACPAFDSPLTAIQLNSIHSYVGTGKTYSSGDKVSAEMFNSLANAIN